MKRKEKIQIGVVLCSVLLIIISIVGDTYAYFTADIKGNDTAKDTVITTGTMKIKYTNSNEIKGEKLLPGWVSEEKTFTVENVGTLPVSYDINIVNVINTFKNKIDGITGDEQELIFSLTGSNDIRIENKVFPVVDEMIYSNISIAPKEVHTYTMQVTFQELGMAQDYNQDRSFSGKIQIRESLNTAEGTFVEAPVLNNGMIPVTYNGSNWVKADTTTKWYDYDAQWWANAVTVKENVRDTYAAALTNTPISMDDIETMWVWIPRYEYNFEILKAAENYGGTEEEPGTKTQPKGIEINFISKDTVSSSSDNFIIHDAFWWDDNNNKEKDLGEQLPGIWVAKFEMSTGDTTCSVGNFSVGTGCDLTDITPLVKPGEKSWRGARIGTMWTVIHEKMNHEYGLSNLDAHLMKNMEWGAVAYLSQSKYGKYGNEKYEGVDKEVAINNCNSYITGIGGDTVSAPSSSTTCTTNTYETEKGQTASTTGNIYGIYDMSGGSYEYVMGIEAVKDSDPLEPAVGSTGSNSSGFSGKVYSGGKWSEADGTYERLGDDPSTDVVEGIGSKYYDIYPYGTSSTDFTRSYYGDATKETAKWYSDETDFIFNMYIFFYRSGAQSDKANAGIFLFSASDGIAFNLLSGRPVAVPVKTT